MIELLRDFLNETGRVMDMDSLMLDKSKFSFKIRNSLESEVQGVILVDLDLINSNSSPTITVCCETEQNCALWDIDLTYEILESEVSISIAIHSLMAVTEDLQLNSYFLFRF